MISDRLKKTGLPPLTVLLVFTVSQLWVYGQENLEGKWIPMPLDEIGAIYHSKKLSDEEIVAALAHHLDERISISRVLDRTLHNPSPPYEYGTLINLIWQRPYPRKPKGRPEAIEDFLNHHLNELQNSDEVRKCLNISLALARGDGTPQAELLDVLNDKNTAKEILSMVLDAMEPNVPIRALPRLLALANHEWNYVYSQGVGPRNYKRIYPIRDRVFTCLRKLGIKCEKITREDDEVEEKWRENFLITEIVIDRKALVKELQIKGDDLPLEKANALQGKVPQPAEHSPTEKEKSETGKVEVPRTRVERRLSRESTPIKAGTEWLVICLTVAGLVIAGLVIFLLLRRKGSRQ